jgi:hypothetical protein
MLLAAADADLMVIVVEAKVVGHALGFRLPMLHVNSVVRTIHPASWLFRLSPRHRDQHDATQDCLGNGTATSVPEKSA